MTDKTTLRRALMSRVEKHLGHWVWNGTLNGNSPVFRDGHDGPQLLARRVAYELFIGPLAPGSRVRATCDESACIAPRCIEVEGCQRHPQRDPDGSCPVCHRERKRQRVDCADCGKTMQRASLSKHRRACKGAAKAPVVQIHRTADERARLIEDIEFLVDQQVGADLICEKYKMARGSPGIDRSPCFRLDAADGREI